MLGCRLMARVMDHTLQPVLVGDLQVEAPLMPEVLHGHQSTQGKKMNGMCLIGGVRYAVFPQTCTGHAGLSKPRWSTALLFCRFIYKAL